MESEYQLSGTVSVTDSLVMGDSGEETVGDGDGLTVTDEVAEVVSDGAGDGIHDCAASSRRWWLRVISGTVHSVSLV